MKPLMTKLPNYNPELLEALRALLQHEGERESAALEEAKIAARAALAKAEAANAQLSSTADGLLAALQELLADKYLSDPINADRMANARAAVAKATGDQP